MACKLSRKRWSTRNTQGGRVIHHAQCIYIPEKEHSKAPIVENIVVTDEDDVGVFYLEAMDVKYSQDVTDQIHGDVAGEEDYATNPQLVHVLSNLESWLSPQSTSTDVNVEDLYGQLHRLRTAEHLSDPGLRTIPSCKSGVAAYIDLHGHCSKRGCFVYGNSLNNEEAMVENVLLALLISVNSPAFDFNACNFTVRNMYLKDRQGVSTKEGSGRVAIGKHLGLTHCYTLECNYNSGNLPNRLSRYLSLACGDEDSGRLTPYGSVFSPHWCNLASSIGTQKLKSPLFMPNPNSGSSSVNYAANYSYLAQFSNFPPRYTPAHYEEVGRGLLLAFLDIHQTNPWPRLACLAGSNALVGVGASISGTGLSEYTSMRALKDWIRRYIHDVLGLFGPGPTAIKHSPNLRSPLTKCNSHPGGGGFHSRNVKTAETAIKICSENQDGTNNAVVSKHTTQQNSRNCSLSSTIENTQDASRSTSYQRLTTDTSKVARRWRTASLSTTNQSSSAINSCCTTTTIAAATEDAPQFIGNPQLISCSDADISDFRFLPASSSSSSSPTHIPRDLRSSMKTGTTKLIPDATRQAVGSVKLAQGAAPRSTFARRPLSGRDTQTSVCKNSYKETSTTFPRQPLSMNPGKLPIEKKQQQLKYGRTQSLNDCFGNLRQPELMSKKLELTPTPLSISQPPENYFRFNQLFHMDSAILRQGKKTTTRMETMLAKWKVSSTNKPFVTNGKAKKNKTIPCPVEINQSLPLSLVTRRGNSKKPIGYSLDVHRNHLKHDMLSSVGTYAPFHSNPISEENTIIEDSSIPHRTRCTNVSGYQKDAMGDIMVNLERLTANSDVDTAGSGCTFQGVNQSNGLRTTTGHTSP